MNAREIQRLVASSPDDLRSAGWAVAVHNDYRLNGKPHTFWLFTRGDRCVKGEGETDEDALNEIRMRLDLPTFVTAITQPAMPAADFDFEGVNKACTITQPIGNCDGTGHYAFDPTTEDGQGERLAEPCPGCRACQ